MRMRRFSISFLLVGALFIFVPLASAQNFAFLSSKEAADACKNASDGEKAQAVGFAQAAMSQMPHALEHLHTEGTLPHHGIRDQSLDAERNFPAARDLAVGYCVTGSADFREHALAILNDWLKVYQPDYNPIDETILDPLFLAADILRSDFSQDTESRWQTFNENFAQNYLKAADGHVQDADNWQSHRIKLATLAAFSTGDTALIGHAESDFTTQLSRNINSDGSVYDFARRDALHYVVYDLEPLVTATLAAHNHGQNWFGITASSGATLDSALAWLAPYASGKSTHQEFANSHVAFDYERRQAGESGFSGQWNPSGAANLYLMAAGLDRQWVDLATSLNSQPALWQRMMLGMP